MAGGQGAPGGNGGSGGANGTAGDHEQAGKVALKQQHRVVVLKVVRL